MNYNIKFDTGMLNDALGFESFKDMSGVNTAQDPVSKFFGNFSTESDTRASAIMNKYIAKPADSSYIDEGTKIKDILEKTSKGISKAAADIARNNTKISALPADIQRVLKPLANIRTKLDSAIGNEKKNSHAYKELTFKKDQCLAAMESMLFSYFANTYNRNVANGAFGTPLTGLESYSYQNAIFYPKLEAMTQWINTAAAIYPKLTKIQQILNEVTSIPVHTQEIIARFTDDAGNIVREVKREELYNTFDTSAFPEAFDMLDIQIHIQKADFMKDIDLRKTIIEGYTAPILTANQFIRSDIDIIDIILDDDTHLGRILDPKAGLVQSEALNEMDWKGKGIKITPNPKEPEKFYRLYAEFDGSTHILTVGQAFKSDAGMKDMKTIILDAKKHDPYRVEKSNMEFKIQERRTFINGPKTSRIDVPLAQTELDILDQRMSGNFLQKITNLCSEYITHSKDVNWMNGVKRLEQQVRKDYNRDPNFTLFAEDTIDMNIPGQVNKEEALNLYIGYSFDIIMEKFNTMANTAANTQLNIFTHSLHLPVIRKVTKTIIGTVNDEEGGKFLGVDTNERISMLTVGATTDTPITSIVVGTDKMDLMAKPSVNPQDTEYDYHIIPTFKESNLETSLLTEIPTRVLSDNNIRSNRRPFIPSLQMDYGSDFRILRAAYSRLTIKGFHAKATLPQTVSEDAVLGKRK